ncbi:uncharacterized protein LOC127261690 isoform X2 [Andrographis paniculata]|uniref:uncharacterized protein LOC127261690 isoform X2 n=1 Tax=Andrographis paniculata TaxID=175694 RepID=UPI0021E7FF73|nr:uncharacterized protein LOC127261690 isoform X2 [Andrographis paniculata]
MTGGSGDAGESCSKPLGRFTVFYYGVGHMLNDITSTCWFTYLLVFLTDIGLPPRNAAVVMLSGQIADGFTTIFAGELIDRYGQFKIWHGVGSLLVAVSFSSVFGGCLPCKIVGSDSHFTQTISYSFSAAVFNVGWAATQVSHMVVLSTCRNAFTMVANLSVYGLALVVFNIKPGKKILDVENQFHWIAYASIFLGCCFVGLFHLGTEEPRLKREAREKGHARISWTCWFSRLLYHQVALVYVLTRLVANVSQSFIAFYVIYDLQMSQFSKALVPAVICTSSFIMLILLQELSWTGRRLKAVYTAGGILWIISGIGILFLPTAMNPLMYVLSVVVGAANALMMVSSTGMQSFLVGYELNGCAFVYGSLSFMDKILSGLALSALESYQRPSMESFNCDHPSSHLSITRYSLGLVPVVCSVVGIMVTPGMKLPEAFSTSLSDTLLA